ncbi:S26 family signal peptidase [Streptomyces fragilis]|uniref:S26 family signal peptidase n=1 Tax=Streptomyces fragilis TaxID=67301 RepID=A0ABV2YCV2_9ACTN|nr:S26 family signal peptidase [Streptomyces fragilis]
MSGALWLFLFLTGVVTATAAVAAALRKRLVLVTVVGVSMQPAFQPGDRVLVRRGTVARAGNVVVVEQPSTDGSPWPDPVTRPDVTGDRLGDRRWLVKRVAAEPGELWDSGTGAGSTVPPGHVALLGDNRRRSLDSRQLGPFPVERVLGSVVLRL